MKSKHNMKYVICIQGSPSQNGYLEFDFLNTSRPNLLVYLASNQQLLRGI